MAEALALLSASGVMVLFALAVTVLALFGMMGLMVVMMLALIPLLKAAREQAARDEAMTREAWSTLLAERGWSVVRDERMHVRGTTSGGAPVSVVHRRVYHSNGKGGGYYEHWNEVVVDRVAPPGRIRRSGLFQLGVDRTVGEVVFDRLAQVDVVEEHLPRFGHRFQALFVDALRSRLGPRVESGQVVVRRDGKAISADQLRDLVVRAEAMAHAIRTGPLEVVLASELREATAPRYRVRCFQQLCSVDPQRARAEAATLRGCGVPQLELEAAAFVDDYDAVLALVDEASLGSAVRLPALRRVVEGGAAEEVAQALDLATELLSPPHQAALLDALAATPRQGVLQGLLATPHVATEAQTAWCRAVAVQPGASAAEPALVELLGSADGDAVIAAATALREVGSAAAVPALKQAAEGGGLFAGARREAACRQAVAAIQARASGAVGDLSLVAPTAERGGLSEAVAASRQRVPETPGQG